MVISIKVFNLCPFSDVMFFKSYHGMICRENSSMRFLPSKNPLWYQYRFGTFC